MSLADWLAEFRGLHQRAAADQLSPPEWVAYRQGREELARALLAAQRLSLKPGETPRQALRVARALQVDLEWPKGQVRALTMDLSVGGFAALLAKAPATTDEVKFTMRLPGGSDLSGRARVADIRVQPANVRVALAFQGLSESDRDRLELVVFDTVLQQLAR
jgi:PilZ domain-containing protein